MKLKLESLENSKFKVDSGQLGMILGGAAPNTGGDSRVLSAGTPQETTITWSSDTVVFASDGSHQSGTYHQINTANDPRPPMA